MVRWVVESIIRERDVALSRAFANGAVGSRIDHS